jgi:hypothetical protein
LSVKPRSADEVKRAMDDADRWRCACSGVLKPGERDNFGIFTSDTFLEPLQTGDREASSRCSSAWWRCRSSSAASSS